MPTPYPAALAVSRRVLRALRVINPLFGVFILVLLIGSLIAPDRIMTGLGAPPTPENAGFVLGMRLIMVIGIVGVLVSQIVLIRLLAIVETVRTGDPFVSENAARLQTIARAVLGLELLRFAVGTTAARISSVDHPLDIEWKFSVTPWLAVLLLFVLARVFDQGTRMREDLEGTV
jgi:hypothetical protein